MYAVRVLNNALDTRRLYYSIELRLCSITMCFISEFICNICFAYVASETFWPFPTGNFYFLPFPSRNRNNDNPCDKYCMLKIRLESSSCICAIYCSGVINFAYCTHNDRVWHIMVVIFSGYSTRWHAVNCLARCYRWRWNRSGTNTGHMHRYDAYSFVTF